MAETTVYRIVVLDDDKIQHLLLRKRFKSISEKIEVITFDQVNAALDFIQLNSVDAILTDLHLGAATGWDFVEELDKIQYKGDLFFLTGSIVNEDRARAFRNPRISGYFEKPLSETDLRQILPAKAFFPDL